MLDSFCLTAQLNGSYLLAHGSKAFVDVDSRTHKHKSIGYAYSQFSTHTHTHHTVRHNMNRNKQRTAHSKWARKRPRFTWTPSDGISLSVKNIVLVFAFPLFSNMFVSHMLCDTLLLQWQYERNVCMVYMRCKWWFWMTARVKSTAFSRQPVTLTVILVAHTFECVCLFWFCCCHFVYSNNLMFGCARVSVCMCVRACMSRLARVYN